MPHLDVWVFVVPEIPLRVRTGGASGARLYETEDLPVSTSWRKWGRGRFSFLPIPFLHFLSLSFLFPRGMFFEVSMNIRGNLQ